MNNAAIPDLLAHVCPQERRFSELFMTSALLYYYFGWLMGDWCDLVDEHHSDTGLALRSGVLLRQTVTDKRPVAARSRA